MLTWRLVGPQHEPTALTGEGAAIFGGRWNPVGQPLVYTADSLALATLELLVHQVGTRRELLALHLDLPDGEIEELEVTRLPRRWREREPVTAAIGREWAMSGRSLALVVPSAVIDPLSGERDVLINPAHPAMPGVTVVQRLEVVLDERL